MKNLTEIIFNETRQVIADKGVVCPEITLKSEFLTDLPMDSLDLATLIVSLELTTGMDPFRDGFKTFHSIAELIHLYESATS